MLINVVKISSFLSTFVALWEREKCQQVGSFKIGADVENERGEIMARKMEGHFDKTCS